VDFRSCSRSIRENGNGGIAINSRFNIFQRINGSGSQADANYEVHGLTQAARFQLLQFFFQIRPFANDIITTRGLFPVPCPFHHPPFTLFLKVIPNITYRTNHPNVMLTAPKIAALFRSDRDEHRNRSQAGNNRYYRKPFPISSGFRK